MSRLACARIIAIVVGVGAIAGVVINVRQIFSAYSELRELRWPLSIAAAVMWLGVAVLAFAGARWHPAAYLIVVVAGTVEVLGDYDSESFSVPLLAGAVIALVVAYRRGGAGIRSLPLGRLVLLGLALVGALLAVAQMQVPGDAMDWYRLRNTSGGTEVRTFVGSPPCAPRSARDAFELDQGCDIVIPEDRARLIMGYAAGAVLFGVAAVAGARVNPGGRPV